MTSRNASRRSTRSWVIAGDRISRPDYFVLVLSETVLVLVLERAQVTERIFDHERLDVYRPAIEYEYRDAEYEYRDAEYEYRDAEYEYRDAEYEYGKTQEQSIGPTGSIERFLTCVAITPRTRFSRVIDYEGHRPIVDQGDLHVGLKNPAFDAHSQRSDLIAKKLVEFSSLFGGRGSIETRPASFSAVAGQGELRNDEDLTCEFQDRAVHFALVVGKGSEVDGLFGKPPHRFDRIALLDT